MPRKGHTEEQMQQTLRRADGDEYVALRRAAGASDGTIERECHVLMGILNLAGLVQVVELLCTAGFPALYTRILTMRQLEGWVY